MEGLATKARRAALVCATVTAAAIAGASTSATADPAGKTTLSQTITAATGAGFNGVSAGPGEPYLVRQGPLGKAKTTRTRRRTSLLFFAQFSDVHIRDTQSPARVDFVDPAGAPLDSAWRAQEALSTQVFDQLVTNGNADRTSGVKQGNGKHAKLGFAITTGDNIDNQQFNELRSFAGV